MDRTLPKGMTKRYFEAQVKECDDGSGECYIELDQTLIDQLEWQEGDELSFKKDGESIVVRNITLESRKRTRE